VTEKRLLALLAMLIGLVGALLLLAEALDITRSQISVSLVAGVLIDAVLARAREEAPARAASWVAPDGRRAASLRMADGWPST